MASIIFRDPVTWLALIVSLELPNPVSTPVTAASYGWPHPRNELMKDRTRPPRMPPRLASSVPTTAHGGLQRCLSAPKTKIVPR
ncbi:hypothetical protein EDB85DRAFT_1955662 [Lactarius pseudohatsudake]|nr:hypothetical protein EDB85DRAFT_1955662 [Lactarius pseudohatsudake]